MKVTKTHGTCTSQTSAIFHVVEIIGQERINVIEKNDHPISVTRQRTLM